MSSSVPSSCPSALDGSPLQTRECRCACGSLVARLVDGGVELKCRRCKRTLVVPLEAPPSRGQALSVAGADSP